MVEEEEKVFYIEKYVPDWTTGCCNCGQRPVVTWIETNGKIGSTDMCGPCTWGEAETIDPDKW